MATEPDRHFALEIAAMLALAAVGFVVLAFAVEALH
jgi:hypothetical protein